MVGGNTSIFTVEQILDDNQVRVIFQITKCGVPNDTQCMIGREGIHCSCCCAGCQAAKFTKLDQKMVSQMRVDVSRDFAHG